jgi:spermidine/putrescine transport system substrate-binding protein
MLLGILLLLFAGGAYTYQAGWFSKKQPEINLLIWSGYEQPELIEPFAKKYGVKVNYKTFFGGDAMFALLTQSKGVYDAVIVDPEYIQKLHALGRLQPLDPAEFDTSAYFEPFRKFPLSWIDSKFYAPVIEFGSMGIVYNTKHLTEAEASSYAILLDPKVKGRVGVWDWYLPIMGVVSRSLGNQKPYDISDAEFEALKRRLAELRPQIRAIHGSFPEQMTSLANEDTWIVPGGAEWAALALKAQGKPYDWTIPKEGGVMWVDTVAIPTDAPHPELGKLYIKWMMSPEAQAALSQKRAYASYVPNQKAYELMTAEHKKLLKWTTAPEIEAMVAKLSVRTLPVRQTEKTWQDAWEAFKAGK